MSVSALPTGSATGSAATPLIDQWLQARQLVEHGRAVQRPADVLFGRIAASAMGSESARRLLGDLRVLLRSDGSPAGSTRLGPDEGENQLALDAARALADVGLLRAVHRSGPELEFILHGQGTRAGARLRRFLDGPWLEMGVEQVLRSSVGADAEVVRNLRAEHPEHGDLELDVVASIDGDPVVFECKSGNRVSEGLPRFGDVTRIVGVEGDRAVVVATKTDTPAAAIAEEFFSIRIIGPSEVEGHVAELGATSAPRRRLQLVDTAEGNEPGSRSISVEGSTPESSGGTTKPTLDDAVRAELETTVRTIVAGSPGTQTVSQLVVGLRDSARCSRAKAHFAVTGLLQRRRLIDADGRKITSYGTLVHEVAEP